MKQNQEMDLFDMKSFFLYYKTILKTLKENLTSVKLFSRVSKPFETSQNNNWKGLRKETVS